MSESIRITDLAEPQLSELQQSIHAFGDTLEVHLNPSEILKEASAAVGLDDITVKIDLAPAQLLEIDHGAQRSADETTTAIISRSRGLRRDSPSIKSLYMPMKARNFFWSKL